MKRLMLLGVVGLTVMLLASATQLSTTHADTPTDTIDFGFDVQSCDQALMTIGSALSTCTTNAGSAANGANPALINRLQIQKAGGLPAQAFFDVATTAWSPNLSVNAAGVGIGSLVGENSFGISTNSDFGIPLGDNNVKVATGAPPACGASGTTAITPTAAYIYNATIAPIANPVMSAGSFNFASYVQSFDDDNNNLTEYTTGADGADGGDTLPQTQMIDPATVDGTHTGLLLGVTHMPDFVPRLLNSTGLSSVLLSRGFSVAVIVPGTAQTDVNFLTLNLQVIGAGYLSITTIGVIDPASKYNPATASQTSLTCAPFSSQTVTYGKAVNNPASIPVEPATTLRTLNSANLGGATVQYFIAFSTGEDYNGDGVAAAIDRCNSGTGGADTDSDGVSGSCDLVGGSIDNCPAAAINCGVANATSYGGVVANAELGGEGTPDGSQCSSLIPVNGFEGGVKTDYPWSLDQDVDCDGVANFTDGCPTKYNPSQKDSDGDGAGDACDAKPALGNAAAGICPAPTVGTCIAGAMPPVHLPSAWVTKGNDYDMICNDAIDIGGAGEGFGGATYDANFVSSPLSATNCFTGADSNDSGTPNNNLLSPDGIGGVGAKDVSGDADKDGVSDREENDADGQCDGNTLNADTDGDSTLDGAEIQSGATLCWQYDVAQNATACGAACNPNGQGSPDSDGDGCTNKEEAGLTTSTGGNRDALWPYDFTEAPTNAGTLAGPSLVPGSRGNKAISLQDVGVVLAYVGKNTASPQYIADSNGDGTPDGLQLDRKVAGSGHLAAQPDGAISLADVGVFLAQSGNSCAPLP